MLENLKNLNLPKLTALEIDNYIEEAAAKINAAVKEYLDTTVAHIPFPEQREQMRAEIEMFFYKYYELYLEHDKTQTGFVFNVKVRRKVNAAFPGEEGNGTDLS